MKKVIDDVTYIIVANLQCTGCIAESDRELCRKLDTSEWDCEPMAGWIVEEEEDGRTT